MCEKLRDFEESRTCVNTSCVCRDEAVGGDGIELHTSPPSKLWDVLLASFFSFFLGRKKKSPSSIYLFPFWVLAQEEDCRIDRVYITLDMSCGRRRCQSVFLTLFLACFFFFVVVVFSVYFKYISLFWHINCKGITYWGRTHFSQGGPKWMKRKLATRGTTRLWRFLSACFCSLVPSLFTQSLS